MELVYLWVEEYKNIKNQGFNFSPKFRCEYDPDTNELTIEENDDYIENFFGENINITAIVGKNGSGKSTILKFFFELLYIIPNKSIYKYFYIIKNHDKLVCFRNKLEIKNKKLTFISNHLLKDFETYYMNISHLENIFDVIQTRDVKISYFGITKDFEINQFIFNQTYQTAELLNDNKFRDLIIEELDIQEPYFLAINFYIETEIQRYLGTQWGMLINDSFVYLCLILLHIPDKIDELHKILDIYNNNDLSKKIKEVTKKLYPDEYEIIEKLVECSEIKEGNLLFFSKNNYKFALNYIYKIFSFYIPYFEFSFMTENKKIINLSSGEKTILFYLDNIINKIYENKPSILLIDEIELYLHPYWQKKILSILLKIFEIKKSQIQIIIATHSPFIISDLLRKNIIFLDNGRQIKGIEKKQTFGANIHTLLSDSFFMEDGFMGEFAKSKIDEVIKLLNKELLEPNEIKYCEQIISIVGEPIVKNQLQKMLDSKRLKKIDRIDEIEKSIQALQEELEKLKDAKS